MLHSPSYSKIHCWCHWMSSYRLFLVCSLHINDNHNLYYHIDAFKFVYIRRQLLFKSYYLIYQGWIRALILSPTNTVLIVSNDHNYIKFLIEVGRYSPSGLYIVLHYHIVTVLVVTYHFILTPFPIF